MPNGSNLIAELQKVRPGDLITATFVNGLISAIWELEDRVSVLENEGRLVVPEDGGQPVRPIVITAAVAKRTDTTLSFEVFGSGLQPDGLKAFSLNGRPFTAARLEGDDSRITFLLDQRRFDLASMVSDVSGFTMARESRDTGSTAPSGLMSRMSERTPFMSARARASGTFAGLENISDFVQPESTRLVLTIDAKSGARASRAVQLR